MISMCIQAHHILVWDVIENGPTPIYDVNAIEVEGTSPGAAMYTRKFKNSRDYTTKERKETSLDNVAKGLISSTVKGVHLAKIRHLATIKEI